LPLIHGTSVVFSISLNRPTFDQGNNDPFDPNLGFLAFGGIAPVPTLKTIATVPLQGFSFSSNGMAVPSNSPDAEFFWYMVEIDAYSFPGSDTLTTRSNNTAFDTGSTVNWLPTPIAVAYNAQFIPPATFDPSSGTYSVDCNATAPAFAVVIAGTSFKMDLRDLIIPQGQGSNMCWSGIQDGGPDVPGNGFTL
jgi:hypothetical protein